MIVSCGLLEIENGVVLDINSQSYTWIVVIYQMQRWFVMIEIIMVYQVLIVVIEQVHIHLRQIALYYTCQSYRHGGGAGLYLGISDSNLSNQSKYYIP